MSHAPLFTPLLPLYLLLCSSLNQTPVCAAQSYIQVAPFIMLFLSIELCRYSSVDQCLVITSLNLPKPALLKFSVKWVRVKRDQPVLAQNKRSFTSVRFLSLRPQEEDHLAYLPPKTEVITQARVAPISSDEEDSDDDSDTGKKKKDRKGKGKPNQKKKPAGKWVRQPLTSRVTFTDLFSL